MKRLVVLVSLCAVILVPTGDAVAQSLGFKAGLQWSEFDGDSGDPDIRFTRREAKVGGIFFRIGLPFVAIQPEILYSQRGTEVLDAGILDPAFETTLELDYIEVPVLLRLGFLPGLYVGPYGAVRVNAKAVSGVEGALSEIDIADSVEDYDYGFVVGLGLNFGKIGVEGRYTQGLRNLLKDPGGGATPDLKHRAFGLFANIGF